MQMNMPLQLCVFYMHLVHIIIIVGLKCAFIFIFVNNVLQLIKDVDHANEMYTHTLVCLV